MGLFDLFKKKGKAPEPVQRKDLPPEERLYNRKFKIAGVTFGDRQKILKQIQQKKPPFDKELNIELSSYDFEGDTAISVTVNGFDVGNIPKDAKEFMLKNKERLAGISDFYVGDFVPEGETKTIYYARIKISVIPKK